MRETFTSPSSVKLLKNLGDRGDKANAETFWVHYAAKNAIGVEMEGVMACELGPGSKWVRQPLVERLYTQRYMNHLRESDLKVGGSIPKYEIEAQAEQVILRSPRDIPREARDK
jgi:hypothetical protein